MAMDIDYTDPGLQSFIIQRCEEERERKINIVNPHTSQNCVVRLADKVAVKFGTGVTEAEADALTFASRNLDPAIIKVPSVFQYFSRPEGPIWTMGYLVMDLVEGASLERLPPAEAVQHAPRIMRAIQHIHGFCGARPGPLDGSRPRGLVWSESGKGPPLNSREQLQRFLDFTMKEAKADITVDAANMALSLCHLDIHPHNFIVAPDQSIYLLDWSCAGFYPAAIETWSIRTENIVRKNAFMNALASHLASCTSPAEMALADALVRAAQPDRPTGIPELIANMKFHPLAQRNSAPPANPLLVDFFGNDIDPSGGGPDPSKHLRRLLSNEPLPPDIAAASAAASRATGRQEDTADIIARMLFAEGFGRGNGPPGMRGPPPPPPPPPPGQARRN